MSSKYTLLDCVVRNSEASTFEIPSAEEIARLKEGDHVKLVFEFTEEVDALVDAERMWVKFERMEDGKMVGVLDNNPFLFHPQDLKLGDTVVFEPRNIASCLFAEE